MKLSICTVLRSRTHTVRIIIYLTRMLECDFEALIITMQLFIQILTNIADIGKYCPGE